MKHYALAIAILGFTACFSKKPETDTLVGTSLPSFKLQLSDSLTTLDTKEIPEGKSIVLFLFMPTCAYSKAQMKNMIENINELKNTHIYAITPYPYPEMKTFFLAYHLDKLKTITTGVDMSNFFFPYTKAPGVPCTAIYDSHKKLVKIFIGQTSVDKIKSAITE